MNILVSELRKTRTTTQYVMKALVSEFLNRGYGRTYSNTSIFQSEIEKEFPGISKWVSQMNKRSIEDIVADELRIPGNQ